MGGRTLSLIIVLLIAGLTFYIVFIQAPSQDSLEVTTTVERDIALSTSSGVVAGVETLQGAIDSGDHTECERAGETGIARASDLCYTNIAYNSRNESLCLRVVDDLMRSRCVALTSEGH